MASFIRGKQAGIQKDLSVGIIPSLFLPDEQARYGINSQLSCLAYDPVQSLLAVGTNESKFGPGKIYIFGQDRVYKFLTPSRPSSIKQLQFVANRLLSLDSKSELSIWDLETAERVAGYSNAGGAICMTTDTGLDWAFLGQPNGDIVAYDLDRERISTFRIPNFWRQRDPAARGIGMIGMQLHPRDIGQMLIAYTHGAVIYSFKQNAPVKFFEYQLPPGAPGGSGEGLDTVRKPRLTHATWHPTGTFLLTAHDDGSLVFWDPKDGRVVMARSIYTNNVDQPTANPGQPSLMDPFIKISWCCKQNPDDTALLVAGGKRMNDAEKGLTFIELGPTPVYATSSWDVLTNHFKGKRQGTLATPPGAEIINYCLVPRFSPYFAGAQDPIAILTMLNSGELITMSFPSGYPISPTNQLHPSLSLVHPFVTRISVATVDRGRWLGMVEKRHQGESLLRGGAVGSRPRRRYEGRNIVAVAHADSTIRIWDVGHADEIENPSQLQVDIARALNRYQDVDITTMDMAELTGEFAVGTSGGEVIVYRWGGNKYFGMAEQDPSTSNPGGITDISSRAEPSLKEGLQPYILYEMMQGPITVVSTADVGFVAMGSELGFFSIIDLRGPSVIFQASMADFQKQEKRTSLFKGHSSASNTKEWPTVIEFGVMTLDGDSYSSIACFVGTNLGRVITFKLLPAGQGYTVKLAGSVSFDDKVIAICPIVADTGRPAVATGPVVASLRSGQQVHGALVVATQSEARIFKPATAKGASKSFDDVLCDAAAVTEFELHGFALVCLFGDRTARAYSLPALKEIGRVPLNMLDGSRTTSATISKTGDIFGWVGPSEFTVLPVWGTGKRLENSNDKLINPGIAVPPRPTISNVQWISGVQYVSPLDLDILIGGPDRPPSKRMMEAAAAEQQLARSGGPARAGSSQEGWGDYLTRQLNERTEKINLMGNSMDNLEASSQGWADDVSKYMNKQKRGILLGSITKGFF